MERICRTPFEYAGRRLKPGERCEIEPGHVTMLTASGHIEREEGDPAPAYVPRDMAAGWPNNYATRAMQAPERKNSAKRRAA